MNSLRLFSRTSCRSTWNIASYHSPHSLTWRWCLSFSRFRSDEWRVWPILIPDRDNNGLQLTIRIPWVGFIRFRQQRPMWYRDLYQRVREANDVLSKPSYYAHQPPSDLSPGYLNTLH